MGALSSSLEDVIWDGRHYIATGSTGTILSSEDGLNWSPRLFLPYAEGGHGQRGQALGFGVAEERRIDGLRITVRPLRLECEDGVYHVLNRGNYRADIFRAEKTTAAFLKEARDGLMLYLLP